MTYLNCAALCWYFRLLAAGCGLLLPAALAPFPAMLLEVCSGCDYAARTGLWASGLCCAALSVQGASVLLAKCAPFWPAGRSSFKPLLWGRALHLPLSLALFYLGLPQSAVESFKYFVRPCSAHAARTDRLRPAGVRGVLHHGLRGLPPDRKEGAK